MLNAFHTCQPGIMRVQGPNVKQKLSTLASAQQMSSTRLVFSSFELAKVYEVDSLYPIESAEKKTRMIMKYQEMLESYIGFHLLRIPSTSTSPVAGRS